MDSETLRQKISQEESAKLEFKIKLHKILEPKPVEQSKVKEWAELREQQWAELVKDILALANGNFGTAADTGFLIIGAANKLAPDGIRDLCDVGEALPTERQILEKVASYSHPSSLKIQCHKIPLDEKSLFVVSIFPSPYLYRLTKALKTPTAEYSTHAVLLRRHDGEETFTASSEEQAVIQQEKQAIQMINHAVNSEQSKLQDRTEKLSPEVYDRKMAVYRTTRAFLSVIGTKAAINTDEILAFGRDTDEALFMFDQEVADYLRELQTQAGKLYGTGRLLDNPALPIGDRRTDLAQANSESLVWFIAQFQIMRTLFRKHIAL